MVIALFNNRSTEDGRHARGAAGYFRETRLTNEP